MYDAFFSYIQIQIGRSLLDHEKDLLQKVFYYKKIRKHQFLLQEGEICRFAGFVLKGALKQYTLDASGKENVLALCLENWWAADRESYIKEIPSPYFIEACEETELLIINKDAYDKFLSGQSFMDDLIKVISERNAFQMLRRLHAMNTQTAEQRLYELENSYPEFFQRFPQHLIASYLGITKETLSRIRTQSYKK
ncbi:MAG: Crp/Fnr family transcriptional regulator [Bacteroidia bacterium]|nr:Crp/Fnr family transcriptional regulator [Bacteroidia bacterium]